MGDLHSEVRWGVSSSEPTALGMADAWRVTESREEPALEGCFRHSVSFVTLG